MYRRARQKIASRVSRLLDGLARGLQDWADDHIHDASGGAADGGKGLLKRHGVDLQAHPKELDDQFSERESGYLIREYPGLAAADDEDGGLHTDQVSTSGVDFSDQVPTGEDENTTFQPVKVRGRSTARGHGLYHQMWLTSSAYQRAWGTPLQGLITGEWSVEPPELDDPSEKQVEEAERRAEQMERALLEGLRGGWHKYVREWLYSLVAGFAPFEPVYHGTGQRAGLIKKLSFIYPSQVDGWIMDEAGQALQAIRFERADAGQQYVLEAENLQLYSHLRMGNNFEGVSTLRSITRWIQTIQLMQQLENLSKERLGVPWITASYDDPANAPGSDKQDDKLMNILQDARAEESPVIRLPNGSTLQMESSAGEEPDFETPKRFAEQQIMKRLNAEGSLIAVGDTGAYAAREEASKDAVQISGFLGELLAANLNGANNMPYTGALKTQEDARFGGPVQPWRYCRLTFSPGETRNPKRAERINSGLQSGALTHDAAVEGAYRKEVDLPLTERQERALQEGPDAVEEMEDEASEGGQQTEQLAAAGDDPPPALVGWEDKSFDELAASAEAHGGLCLRAADIDDLDPDKASGKQDQLEAELANELRSIAVDFRDRWRDEIRPMIMEARDGNLSFRSQGQSEGFLRRLNAKAEQLEEEFAERFQEATREVLDKAAETGAKDLIRAAGLTIGQQEGLELPETEMELRLKARDIAREALNRQRGVLQEKTVELARGSQTISLPVLEKSTFRQVSNRTVSGAYNIGRDRVVKEAKSIAERRGTTPDIIAERSAVMDEDTCDPCEGLDGERALVGSKRYEDIRPPNECEGRGRCRCIFSYILPDERGFEQAVERLKRRG